MIAIDPGSRCPGFAVFSNKVLIHGGTEWRAAWLEYNDELVIEKPAIYPHSKARPNDIITLAISAGRLAQQAGAKKETWVLPRSWKGSIPKTRKTADYIIYKRIMNNLSDTEGQTLAWMLGVVAVADENNIIDAVGLGMYHLGRLK